MDTLRKAKETLWAAVILVGYSAFFAVLFVLATYILRYYS